MLRVLIALIFCTTLLSAQDVGLTARAEKQDLRIGEPVRVTVTARLAVEADSIGPLPVDSIGYFEVLGYTRDGSENEWSFELMTIDTGKVYLPPIAFGYVLKDDTVRQTAYANSLAFNIAGIDVPADADIKDIKPPLSAPWGLEDVWPYLLVVVLIGVGWYVYTRYFRKSVSDKTLPVPEAPRIPAHVTALRELRALEDRKLWQQGETKEYYSECTEIVRRFFEGRFGFPALELTSDETIEGLRRQTIDPDHLPAVEELFQRADIVKFAKGQPSPDEHARELVIAYEIVRSMAEPEPASGSESPESERVVHAG